MITKDSNYKAVLRHLITIAILVIPLFALKAISWPHITALAVIAAVIVLFKKTDLNACRLQWIFLVILLYFTFHNRWLFSIELLFILGYYVFARPKITIDIFQISIIAAMVLLFFYYLITNQLSSLQMPLLVLAVAINLLYPMAKEGVSNKQIIIVTSIFAVTGLARVAISEYYSTLADDSKIAFRSGIHALHNAIRFNKLNYKSYVELLERYYKAEDHENAARILAEYYEAYPYNMKDKFSSYNKVFVVTGNLDKISKYKIDYVEGLNFDDNYALAVYYRDVSEYSLSLYQMRKVLSVTESQRRKTGIYFLNMGLYEIAEDYLNGISIDKEIQSALTRHLGNFKEHMEFSKYQEMGRVQLIKDKTAWIPQTSSSEKQTQGWQLLNTGSSYADMEIIKDAKYLFIKAYGSIANEVWPIMGIYMDNRHIKNVYVNSDMPQYYKVDLKGVALGEKRLRLSFKNDLWYPGIIEDRNLYLGEIYVVTE